jgi:hypothetical protein
MNEARDRVRTRVEEGNPPARVHGQRAPRDLFVPSGHTLTREEYREAQEAEDRRRKA